MTQRYRSVTLQLAAVITLLFLAGICALYGVTPAAAAVGVFLEGAGAAIIAFLAGRESKS